MIYPSIIPSLLISNPQSRLTGQTAELIKIAGKTIRHHFPPICPEVAQKVSFFFPSSSVSSVSSAFRGATAGSVLPGRYGDCSGRGAVPLRRKPRASSRSRGARSQGATAQRRQVKNNRGTSKMMGRKLVSGLSYGYRVGK